jgi:acetyl-CoA carboxylase carboxyltransferase component
MSALGIPQMTAIMGMCVAGGAYLPVMTDTVLMTEGSGLFLAGPALVQAAIGQKTSAEDLGGATMHSEISGTVDFKEPNDHLCIARMRSLVAKMGTRPGAPFDRQPYDAAKDKPLFPAEELHGFVETDPAAPAAAIYDTHEVIKRIVDRSTIDEYKADYGRTLLCCYARIGGHAVAIVANQRQHQQATAPNGDKRTEFGGVIYAESAEKAARFIMDANQNLIPLIFLHDVNGFMVGKDAEWSGIIRAGAKMVSAVSNSVVPKISVILAGSFGAGNYAMCGKAYDPRFIFAWPTAKYAVMSGSSAASTLVEIRLRQLERQGEKLGEPEKKLLTDSIRASYESQTRGWLLAALEACALNPEVPKFNPGVLQT